ncbi:MAG: family 43 glycosylhydrolase, partial [Phocaeicola sp.]
MKNITKNFMLLFSVSTLLIQPITAQKKYNEASTGNPIVPGYYADPTVRKFGDTYYMYATTDGTGGGKGPSQVWVSKDFVNWTMLEMNWPTTPFIWAPDVVEKNGKYYYYYSEPCIVYGGVSDTPLGPWKNLNEDGTPIIENGSIKDIITLDGQMFTDDDGKMYIYFGTWGIYKNSGCGVYQVAEDMKTMSNPVLIPNTDIKDFFEAPYVIKKDGIYYFTYSAGSCHDETYRVQYATSTEGPCGPFKFQDNNPILTTNADGTVHGPGHHSLLEHENEWYIVYHRHDNPHSGGGMFRQLAADKMEFGAPGIIKNVVPTHDGIGFLGENVNPFPNIALNKPVRVSSYIDEDYKPAYAVDDNNGTCWFPGDTNGDYWMEVDLGEEKNIRKIETDFRYGTLVYQYKIEASKDGKDW